MDTVPEPRLLMISLTLISSVMLLVLLLLLVVGAGATVGTRVGAKVLTGHEQSHPQSVCEHVKFNLGTPVHTSSGIRPEKGEPASRTSPDRRFPSSEGTDPVI